MQRSGLPNQSHHASYPLAVQDAGLGTALGLTLKTLPFALIRFAILAGSAIAGLAISALALYLYTKWAKADSSAMGLLLVLCLVMGTSWHFILRYSLYLLKAGHVAVLTELITRGQVGDRCARPARAGQRRPCLEAENSISLPLPSSLDIRFVTL